MFVTELGTVRNVRLLHPLNAFGSIYVTELGMVIVVRFLQPLYLLVIDVQ